MPTVLCPVCQTPFHVPPARLRKVAEPKCSRQCNGRLRAVALVRYSGNGKGRKRQGRYGPENPAWKGGVTLWRKHGNYPPIKYVRAPAWAAAMARKYGYVMEHRLIVARMAGRLLARTEVVHHRSHDPQDNREANLELWPTNADHKRGERGRFVPGVANLWCRTGLELP